MVKLEISDYAWKVWRNSWKLLNVKGKRNLIKFLEVNMIEGSINMLEDAKKHPENYPQD